ncbi:hypothetical protein DPEC_G00112240 [Dallia pectoralis]|uniref:Uncharacterized protein n=1 Tax=Dallia pectoralis TaxID=75939 RepID=A0ACC2GTP7_DALPE|nr:hypothetical protein DPEC_G00112240 [Dallia pectoralis]
MGKRMGKYFLRSQMAVCSEGNGTHSMVLSRWQVLLGLDSVMRPYGIFPSCTRPSGCTMGIPTTNPNPSRPTFSQLWV